MAEKSIMPLRSTSRKCYFVKKVLFDNRMAVNKADIPFHYSPDLVFIICKINLMVLENARNNQIPIQLCTQHSQVCGVLDTYSNTEDTYFERNSYKKIGLMFY